MGIPVNPNTSVEDLVSDLGGRYESSRVTLSKADDSALDVQTLTLPAVASATQADYVVIYNAAGATEALWLDIDADGTTPTGAAYVAADTKTKVSVTTGQTAAQVATALFGAIALADVTPVDNSDGTVTISGDNIGPASAAVPKNADDSGAGSITATHDTTGATSSFQNKYFTFRTGADAARYVWFNVNAEGSDPSPGGTGSEVSVRVGDTEATIGANVADAINGVSGMDADYEGAGVIKIGALADANITDIAAGNAPVTASVAVQGESALDYPGMSPGSISLNPAAL